MLSRTILRLAISLSVIVVAPALLADGPAGAPPYGTERFQIFFSCSTGSPVYAGHEEWHCDTGYYSQGNTNTNRAKVSDTDCDTWIGEEITYWCRTNQGYWYEFDEQFFNSCHPCFDIGN